MAKNRNRNARRKTANGNGSKSNGGNATRRINATVPMSYRASPAALQGVSIVARRDEVRPSYEDGVDFVQRLRVKGTSELTDASSRILLKQPISPSSFPGTRITGLSNLWERYRWAGAVMRYVPAVPNTVACQIVAYIDTDPNDDPNVVTDADDLIRQATAQAGSRQLNFNRECDVPLIIRKDDQLYYTGEDKQNQRFSLQGVLYVIQVTDLVDFNGAKVSTGFEAGTFYLHWACMFSMPQINPSFLYPDPPPPPTVTTSFKLADTQTVNGTGAAFTFTGLTPGKSYFPTYSGAAIVTPNNTPQPWTTTGNITKETSPSQPSFMLAEISTENNGTQVDSGFTFESNPVVIADPNGEIRFQGSFQLGGEQTVQLWEIDVVIS